MAAIPKKVVLLLGLHENDDAKEKRKVLKAVSTFPGLDLIAVDMKERMLTVVGLVDPLELVTKLRKLWHADILFVGPAKDDKREGGGATAGGVNEEYYNDKENHTKEVVTTAKLAERPVDMRSWPPHAAAVHVYPPRPRYPPYPYHHPHVHGAQGTNPHGYYVAYGHGGAQEGHPNPYVARGHGARENPQIYYGAQEGPPNACAIC